MVARSLAWRVEMLLHIEFALNFAPNRSQLFFYGPLLYVFIIQFFAHRFDDRPDVTNMFGLLAQRVIQQFVNDQILRAVNVYLSHFRSKVNFDTALKSRLA